MDNFSTYLLLPAMLFLLLACVSTEKANDKASKQADAQKVESRKERQKSPPVKSITKYKTSPEDEKGTLLSKEIYNEKGLKTTFIGYDYYGSGDETDKTTYEYNDLDQLVKMVATGENPTTTETHTYDEEGRLKTTAWTRPNGTGASEESIYNEQGDLKETKYFTASGDYDFSRVYEYEYNDQGKVVVEKKWEKYTDGSADLLQYHLSYTYDVTGNLKSKSFHRDSGEEYSKEVYAYDAHGMVVEILDYEDGGVENREIFKYNEYGEVIEDATYSGRDVLNYTNTYVYDDYGHQISMMYVHKDGESWGERTVYEF